MVGGQQGNQGEVGSGPASLADEGEPDRRAAFVYHSPLFAGIAPAERWEIVAAANENNPVSIALKMAATSLRQSKTYLGARFRRLRTKLGAPIAIKAMPAKLARLVYRMLRHGREYMDKGAAFYELKHRQLHVQRLKWKAAQLGSNVTPIPAA